MKRSVSYETGERLTPETVTNVPLFTRYAQQEIGVDLPLGNGRRQGWSKYVKEEMAAQGWEISDLVTSVRFIKTFNKQCRSPHGILWYVKDAREWDARSSQHLPQSSLHLKVAEALEKETDDGWARKLSLAKGKALERVYESWLEHVR